MKQVTYDIPSWSFKTYRARYNYSCANCGGIIVAGTQYLRHVERLGANKGVDPLRNVHVHLDCMAPWYQPESPHRLRSVGKLPGRTPRSEVYDGQKSFLKPSITIVSDELGTLLWQPPQALCEKLVFTKRPGIATSAMAEIESSLTIVLTALMQASGNQRKAMRLNHLISEMADLLSPTTPQKSLLKK
jgi:hypothetical protein